MAEYLASERIGAVYASPLRRAVQTAEPVAAGQRVEIVVDDGIAEYDRAAAEYIPIEQLKAEGLPGWQDVLTGQAQRAAGVDPIAFRTAVVEAVEAIIAANPGGAVAAVCHGGVINAYLSHVIGLDDPSGFFYPNYTSIHRVAAAAQRPAKSAVAQRDRSPARHGTGGRAVRQRVTPGGRDRRPDVVLSRLGVNKLRS